MSHHPRPPAPSQIISAPFIEQSPYLTAIPVQPVIAPSNFPESAAVISPLPPPSDYVHSNVVLTPAQNQIQDHLQRKHEELQKLIVQQQDELRRVSEQLFMARYGILPSIVNVSLPFVAPIEQANLIDTGNRCISSTSNLSQQPSYQEHQSQMIQHHVLQTSNPQTQTNPQVQPVIHQQALHQQQQMTLSYDMSAQKQNMEHAMESDASGSDIMQQYMQQPQIQQQSQQQQMINNDDFELIPFQMMSQQAQVLYATGNNNNNNANSANSSANNNK
jgi:circadian locomoter output cycle kaput protein